MVNDVIGSLAAFLLARLEEDYEIAYGGAPSPWRVGDWDGTFDGPREILDRSGDLTAHAYYGGTTGHIERFDPTRTLRDIAAKRRIVEIAQEVDAEPNAPTTLVLADDVLRALAAPYADHADFLEEWLT